EQTLSGVSANSQLSNFGQLPSNVSGPATIPLGPNVFFPNTVDGVTGVSESPTLASFSINAMSGFRATYGVPLPSGQFEYSAFIFQTRRGGFPTADVNVPGSLIQPQIISNPATTVGLDVGQNGLLAQNGQTAQFISQSSLLNGQLSDSTFINYDVN